MLLRMNVLAAELNQDLEGTIVSRLLSEFGKRIYFPRGIVAQASEADRGAHRFNATVGIAASHGQPVMLPSLQMLLSDLTPKEAVAYAPTAGVPALRELWKKEMIEKNPSLAHARFSLPAVTSGITNGIFQAASLFVNPGDVVILPDLCWDNYQLIFEEQRGARVVHFPFFAPGSSAVLNIAGLREVMQAHRGAGRITLMLNFPNNPTGYSPSFHEMDQLIEAITDLAESGTDLLVICDDAYFGLYYEPETCPESIFARLASCHDRVMAVKVDGATKEEFAWGFRIGFVTVGSRGLTDNHYAAIEKKLMGSIRSTVSSSSGLAQNLLVHVMKSASYHEEKQVEFSMLNERYRKVREIVSAYTKGNDRDLEPLPFNSGYFMSFRCGRVDAEELRNALLAGGIGVISIQGNYLRVAFSGVDEESLPALFDEIFSAARAVRKVA